MKVSTIAMHSIKRSRTSLGQHILLAIVLMQFALFGSAHAAEPSRPPARQTVVSISGQAFLINGRPTYPGRTYQGMKVEGLLMNSRMVQGIFDDQNPETRKNWDYPDGPFSADRNTREFLAAMPAWRQSGMLSFTINLQGGSPRGYSQLKDQVWQNSAINADGSLRDHYLARLAQILDKADELGMAPILGIFYFGQQHKMNDDEEAVIRAVDNTIDWLLERSYTNVMIEIANECDDPAYDSIIRPARAHELIERVKQRSAGKVSSPAKRLLVSTSFGGGKIPPDNVIAAADFVLLHGNGVAQPDQIRKMVDQTRGSKAFHDQPVLFNEDDHFDFDKPDNNLLAAVSRYASWGYFDYRMRGEGFEQGYQSVSVDWSISSERKKGFFRLLKEITEN
jgi:hypothetical protein